MKSNRETLSAIEVELRKRPLNDREKALKKLEELQLERWKMTERIKTHMHEDMLRSTRAFNNSKFEMRESLDKIE